MNYKANNNNISIVPFVAPFIEPSLTLHSLKMAVPQQRTVLPLHSDNIRDVVEIINCTIRRLTDAKDLHSSQDIVDLMIGSGELCVDPESEVNSIQLPDSIPEAITVLKTLVNQISPKVGSFKCYQRGNVPEVAKKKTALLTSVIEKTKHNIAVRLEAERVQKQKEYEEQMNRRREAEELARKQREEEERKRKERELSEWQEREKVRLQNQEFRQYMQNQLLKEKKRIKDVVKALAKAKEAKAKAEDPSDSSDSNSGYKSDYDEYNKKRPKEDYEIDVDTKLYGVDDDSDYPGSDSDSDSDSKEPYTDLTGKSDQEYIKLRRKYVNRCLKFIYSVPEEENKKCPPKTIAKFEEDRGIKSPNFYNAFDDSDDDVAIDAYLHLFETREDVDAVIIYAHRLHNYLLTCTKKFRGCGNQYRACHNWKYQGSRCQCGRVCHPFFDDKEVNWLKETNLDQKTFVGCPVVGNL